MTNSRNSRSARHHRLKLAIIASLAFIGCSYQIVHRGKINWTQVAKVEAGIQRIRELQFKQKVPLLLETPREASKILRQELSQKMSDEEYRDEGEAGALLGLFPPGIDLKAETLKLMESQVSAFYDGDEKIMVILTGGTNAGFWYGVTQFFAQRDVVGEMVLAHELTHALQDQYFNIQKRLDNLKDDDQSLALTAVAEGDATLAGFAYVLGAADPATIAKLVHDLQDLPKQFIQEAGDIPRGVSEPVVFEYSAGSRFVAEALRRGGWKAVDRIYQNPPQATRQIIHPELYFDRFTPPVSVTFTCYDSPIDGWQKVEDNTVGQLMLQVLLENHIDENEARTIADFWRGDHIKIMRRNQKVAVAWVLALESPYAAQRFASIYAQITAQLPGGNLNHYIEQRGNQVLIMAGLSVEESSEGASCIWKSLAVKQPR